MNISEAFRNGKVLAPIIDAIEEYNERVKKVSPNKADVYFAYFESLTEPISAGLNINGNRAQWFSDFKMRSRVRSFEKELHDFFNLLSNEEIKELFSSDNLVYYFFEEIFTNERKSFFEEALIKKASEEYENLYLDYLVAKYARVTNSQEVPEIPYDEVYAKTNSDYGQDNYTASAPEDSEELIAKNRNSASPKASKVPLEGFIFYLKNEYRYYKIGDMLEKTYQEITEANDISATKAICYMMRINAILQFIPDYIFRNISAFMYNNYDWMSSLSYPLFPGKTAEKIKEEFRVIIYGKKTHHNQEEYTDTAGKKYEDEIAYGSSLTVKEAKKEEVNFIIDDAVLYLISSGDKEYEQVGHDIKNQLGFLASKGEIHIAEKVQLEKNMLDICSAITEQMARDISSHTIAINAAFSAKDISSTIIKEFTRKIDVKLVFDKEMLDALETADNSMEVSSKNNIIDDVIGYLITSNNFEYEELGNRIKGVANHVKNVSEIDDEHKTELIAVMRAICNAITKEMANEISTNVVAKNASFSARSITGWIEKELIKRIDAKNKNNLNNNGLPTEEKFTQAERGWRR